MGFMDVQYRLLGSRTRLQVRHIARRAYVASGGDERQSKELAEVWLRAAPKSIIATILIGVAVKLAIELIVYWIKHRFADVPSGDFQTGEPGS